MSPGPDFAVVSRYSVRYGIRLGCYISIGIGAGILVHIAYSLLGVALIINTTPWLYQSLLMLAAAYFFWLGLQAIRSPAEAQTLDTSAMQKPGAGKAWLIGFFTNALNPKATLFFLALFTSVIAPTTPMMVKAGYGLYMALATMLWFCLLSVLLGNTYIRMLLLQKGYWFDRIMGVFLWALAAHLLWQWWLS
ncbi:lysine transporter LysE [Aliidiomarina minuta]|uniref:Lysine transporter LysE n=1 Tax=Aliidiomarina minuta TaxID=880057 RepID=A0A432WAF5_9GAMM|nr:LysE family transporter [Aliidiomarina minuta]RUO27092.1 lysine transporter LysE [Aliidiomarina minuta]